MDYINIISPFLGIFLGWFLAQLAQWYRGRKEDNRIRKEALFNMLEIRFALIRLKSDHLSELLVDIISTKFEIERESASQHINKFLNNFLPPIEDILQQKLDRHSELLDITIKNLASVNPIIAYKLNDRINSIKNAKFLFGNLSQEINTNYSSSDDLNYAQKIRLYLNKKINQDTLTETIAFFEIQIRKIYAFIYPLSSYRIKKILREQELVSNRSDLENEMDALMSQINR